MGLGNSMGSLSNMSPLANLTSLLGASTSASAPTSTASSASGPSANATDLVGLDPQSDIDINDVLDLLPVSTDCGDWDVQMGSVAPNLSAATSSSVNYTLAGSTTASTSSPAGSTPVTQVSWSNIQPTLGSRRGPQQQPNSMGLSQQQQQLLNNVRGQQQQQGLGMNHNSMGGGNMGQPGPPQRMMSAPNTKGPISPGYAAQARSPGFAANQRSPAGYGAVLSPGMPNQRSPVMTPVVNAGGQGHIGNFQRPQTPGSNMMSPPPPPSRSCLLFVSCS